MSIADAIVPAYLPRSIMFKRFRFLLVGVATILALPCPAHGPVVRARTPVRIPDIPGFLTLKCDFHMHTVFSDGQVWPTVRAEEAWRQGLDVIAITDHIEAQPHKADVSTDHNRSYEIAQQHGSQLDVLVIRGAEITRKMPPGHLNAIFLTNAASLDVPDWRDAVAIAHQQGAFIFWNHPGRAAQWADRQVKWHPEHTELFEQGMLQGIEVVNRRDYSPHAHHWALEKGLTMFSNSDIHNALNLDYRVHEGDHRPITLVFAEARTPEAIHQALLNRRTAVYSGNQLIGEERFLEPIFHASVCVLNPSLSIKEKQRVYLQIQNDSDLDFQLERISQSAELSIPAEITLPAQRTLLLSVRGRAGATDGTGTIKLLYRVTNLQVGPDQPLETALDVQLTSGTEGGD